MKTTLALTLVALTALPGIAMAGGDKGQKYGDRYTHNRDAYQRDAYAYNTHYRSADSREIGRTGEFEHLEVAPLRRSSASTGGAVYSW